ncbi:hypothetical protein MJT46_002843 [Ovis ammon polii x Ovis aries]|nr:hypothetical protein MJT46_002843 [Ovis ammon polii x Ovis aries]
MYVVRFFSAEEQNPSEKPDVFRNSSSSVLRFILGLPCEEDQEVLDGILPAEPSAGLKRQFPNDSEDARAVSGPGKIPRKEANSLPQRNVNCNTGESEELPIEVADFECALCMSLTRDVPIFVCSIAFPTMPCLLHVFEPRYRLMIRRCLETGAKRSGLCLSAEHAGISEYGCMLAVKDVRTFPDGGSVIDAVGISCFRVLNHRHRDGYNRQPLNTQKMKGSDSESKSNPGGPAWSWWMLAVLPLARKAQLATLGMISLKEHLLAIRRILVIITRWMFFDKTKHVFDKTVECGPDVHMDVLDRTKYC